MAAGVGDQLVGKQAKARTAMLHSGYVSGLPLAAIGSLLWCEKWRGKPHGRIWIAADRV